MAKKTLKFAKMHGAGNDYILAEEADLPEKINLQIAARLVSDRHRGVGGDGLIVIRRSARASARMEMYNADGTPSPMCGNGLRLVAKLLCDRGRAPGDSFLLESGAGVHEVTISRRGGEVVEVTITMGRPLFEPSEVPVDAPGATGAIVTIPVIIGNEVHRAACLSVGNPHCVIFVNDVTHAPVGEAGPRIERDPRFPARANVGFVEISNRAEIRSRTWERGAGETRSCGSGACAAAVAASATGRAERRVRVSQLGGALEVEWRVDGIITLTGPAELSFIGEWSPPAELIN